MILTNVFPILIPRLNESLLDCFGDIKIETFEKRMNLKLIGRLP
jgi:hypothetical protein